VFFIVASYVKSLFNETDSVTDSEPYSVQ